MQEPAAADIIAAADRGERPHAGPGRRRRPVLADRRGAGRRLRARARRRGPAPERGPAPRPRRPRRLVRPGPRARRREALEAALAEIDKLAADEQVRGIGETGLDYFRTGPEGVQAQQDSFRAHIAIAKRHGKALVIHDRDAHEDVLRILLRKVRPKQWSSTAIRVTPRWPKCAPSGATTCPSPATSPTRRTRHCRRHSRWRRSTGSWSRPTRRSSLRFLIEDGRTRPTWFPIRCAPWRPCGAWTATPVWPNSVRPSTGNLRDAFHLRGMSQGQAGHIRRPTADLGLKGMSEDIKPDVCVAVRRGCR